MEVETTMSVTVSPLTNSWTWNKMKQVKWIITTDRVVAPIFLMFYYNFNNTTGTWQNYTWSSHYNYDQATTNIVRTFQPKSHQQFPLTLIHALAQPFFVCKCLFQSVCLSTSLSLGVSQQCIFIYLFLFFEKHHLFVEPWATCLLVCNTVSLSDSSADLVH